MKRPRKSVTSHDVARRAGVSQATVSYVLSGRRSGEPRIKDETRQRVLTAAAELEYVPNQTARSLRRRRTERVCLLLSQLGVPYYDRLIADVQQAADAHGYVVIVTVSGSVERESHVLDQLRRGLADGVLIPYHIDPAYLTPLVEMGLSIVVMSNYVAPAGFDVVRTTEAAACEEAVRYLIGKGHRRIGFLGHRPDSGTSNERYESYLRALVNAGIMIDRELVREGAETREAAYHGTRALLGLPQRPTAIFAGSEVAAASAIHAIHTANLRVPQDVAVIGVGNIPEGEVVQPRLSTVGQELLEFSAVARLLFERLQADTPLEGRELVLPWHVIVRESG